MDRYGSAIIVGFTYMYICHDCGGLVANKDQHNGFHDQLDGYTSDLLTLVRRKNNA